MNFSWASSELDQITRLNFARSSTTFISSVTGYTSFGFSTCISIIYMWQKFFNKMKFSYFWFMFPLFSVDCFMALKNRLFSKLPNFSWTLWLLNSKIISVLDFGNLPNECVLSRGHNLNVKLLRLLTDLIKNSSNKSRSINLIHNTFVFILCTSDIFVFHLNLK